MITATTPVETAIVLRGLLPALRSLIAAIPHECGAQLAGIEIDGVPAKLNLDGRILNEAALSRLDLVERALVKLIDPAPLPQPREVRQAEDG